MMQNPSFPRLFFLHRPSGDSWEVENVAAWLLDHAGHSLLGRARERLLRSPDDPGRLLRVVLRRCDFVFLHAVSEDRVVAHYWGTAPELRSFFKEQDLARPGIRVVLWNRRTDHLEIHESETHFLFGEQARTGFPWEMYQGKYKRRNYEEPDDGDAAPQSPTNFQWDDGGHNCIAWRMLKSFWRSEHVACPNCDVPAFLLSFSWNRGPLSWRPGRVERACSRCRRVFDRVENEPLLWLASTLETDLRPCRLVWPWRRFKIDWDGSTPRLS